MTKCSCRLLFLLTLAGSLFAACPANGDLGPLKVSGGAPTAIFPHQHIRMDYMDVTIRLKNARYRVDAVFHFFNTGDTMTEWVGFLERGDVSGFKRYDAWVDGRKVNVTEEPSWLTRKLLSLGRSYPRHSWFGHKIRYFVGLFIKTSVRDLWLMQQVTFPGNLRTTIRVSYEADYERSGLRSAIYEYGTGGYWKGGIGAAAITINAADIGGVKSFTLRDIPNWRRLTTENALRLETTSYKPEPKEQLEVLVTR